MIKIKILVFLCLQTINNLLSNSEKLLFMNKKQVILWKIYYIIYLMDSFMIRINQV